MRKITVALNLSESVGDIINYARHVAAQVNGNAYFPAPPVAIATFEAHITDLANAEAVTRTRVLGAAAERDAKLALVRDDLARLRAYVQTIAGEHAEDAEAVVASAGMSLKQSSGPSKPDFEVKQGRVSGSVQLVVRHPGIAASFEWQSSSDGVDWVDVPPTVHASADIEGFSPGALHQFRYRTVTRDGRSDWSDAISFRVM